MEQNLNNVSVLQIWHNLHPKGRGVMPERTVLEEIRRVRHKISAKMDHDPKRLVEYYAKLQEERKNRLVNCSKEQHPAKNSLSSSK